MSESNPWAGQWFKAQQQFVDAWSDMAKAGNPNSQKSQADLWAQSFDLWRNAAGSQSQPDIQQAVNKCVDMGREYFAMAEQVSKAMSAGAKPTDAINQWMEQLKQSLQQFGSMPGFDHNGVNDFMKQWFNPAQSWQQMTSAFAPMNQTAWQMPGMNTAAFNLGEMVDPLGKMLEAPGIGYFRESQEKQQKGIQLAIEYQQANHAFNQAFLRVSIDSIQDFQTRLLKLGKDEQPKSLRALYDLWVEVSEEHYAEFAMGEEYQELYGDMVNRLMIMKKHYAEITDDALAAMNLPNAREVDTMQQRLQQLRRENFALRKEIDDIRSILSQASTNTAKPVATSKPGPARRKAAPRPAARKAAVKTAAKKKAAKPATAKPVAKKAPAKKKAAVTKAKKGA